MSCSTHAAHRSSRSSGSPGCRPAAASSSKRPSAIRATCATCGFESGCIPYCAARFSTLAWRTSSNSGGSLAARWRSKKTPSRRPASVTSMPSKRPADADEAAAGAAKPAEVVGELALHVLTQRRDLLRLGGAVAGQEALGHPHCAHPPRPQLGGMARVHAHELHAAAAEVEDDAV